MISIEDVGVGEGLTSPDTKVSIVFGGSVIGTVGVIFFLDCLSQSV
jgi:hypothetical protein